MRKISLVVIDDHPVFRQGVAEAMSLEPHMKVQGQASRGDQALELIRSPRPEVVVLDVNLIGINAQQITH